MKRIKFNILRFRGIEVFLLPAIGIKEVEYYSHREIRLCFAWLCFGVSIRLWTIKRSDTE